MTTLATALLIATAGLGDPPADPSAGTDRPAWRIDEVVEAGDRRRVRTVSELRITETWQLGRNEPRVRERAFTHRLDAVRETLLADDAGRPAQARYELDALDRTAEDHGSPLEASPETPLDPASDDTMRMLSGVDLLATFRDGRAHIAADGLPLDPFTARELRWMLPVSPPEAPTLDEVFLPAGDVDAGGSRLIDADALAERWQLAGLNVPAEQLVGDVEVTPLPDGGTRVTAHYWADRVVLPSGRYDQRALAWVTRRVTWDVPPGAAGPTRSVTDSEFRQVSRRGPTRWVYEERRRIETLFGEP